MAFRRARRFPWGRPSFINRALRFFRLKRQTSCAAGGSGLGEAAHDNVFSTHSFGVNTKLFSPAWFLTTSNLMLLKSGLVELLPKPKIFNGVPISIQFWVM